MTITRFSARARLALPLAAASLWLSRARPVLAAPAAQSPSLPTIGPFPTGATVALHGTPHLWVADERGTLHWAGDTRALRDREVRPNLRTDVTPDVLELLPRGAPWLSAGLVKIGDPIYLAKWETSEAQPRLLHVRDLKDLDLFGIDSASYGALVRDRAAWESAFGFKTDALAREVLPAAQASTPAAGTRWRRVTSPELKFGVLFPQDALYQTRVVSDPRELPRHITEFRSYSAEAHSGNTRLIVSVGVDTLTPAGAREWSRLAEEGALPYDAQGSPGLDLLSQHQIRLGRHPGIESHYVYDKQTRRRVPASFPPYFSARFYVAGGRAYTVAALHGLESHFMADTARVLDSFTLLP